MDERRTAAAAAVLQHRLRGATLRAAVASVAASHRLSQDEVLRAWARKKHAALTELTVGRVVDACPWTEAEMATLSKIFSGRLAFATAAGRDETAGG